ncbi:ABC transporter permease [Spiribacter insolitus]|uniref:ABC transporter permease n=1 Tax=Spiribacter insolitus TaxID=3122417 RepID=A0ABV3T6B6_9GAMM
MIRLTPPLAWLTLLLAAAWLMPALKPVFEAVAPDRSTVIYPRDTFLSLLGEHVAIVAVAAVMAIVIGVGSAVLVTRRSGEEFLPLVSQLASIGQTFPPVAVLALSVPALGYGAEAVVVALVLYGLLPIVRNTLAGLQSVDRGVIESARGIGLSPRQVLFQVELPIAAPAIMGGIRTSVTINIATAAIGSTIGANTLGDPIISGIVNNNIAFTLQGAVLIGLLAVTVDSAFSRIA